MGERTYGVSFELCENCEAVELDGAGWYGPVDNGCVVVGKWVGLDKFACLFESVVALVLVFGACFVDVEGFVGLKMDPFSSIVDGFIGPC